VFTGIGVFFFFMPHKYQFTVTSSQLKNRELVTGNCEPLSPGRRRQVNKLRQNVAAF